MKKQLNIGDKVRMTQRSLNWYFDHAYECNCVGGELDAAAYNTEILALLEHCLGEPAIVVRENWSGTPEYNYRIKVGKWETNIEPKDLRRIES